MAPRSRWQKRARLMVAARQPRRSDGSMMNVSTTEWIEHDDELMLLNDEQMGPVMSRLQWQKCAGSHLRKAYNGTGRSTVFARKAILKKRQQIMLGSRPLTSYFARQSSTISDPSPNVTETSGDTTCASPSLDGSEEIVETSSLEIAIQRLNDIFTMRNNSIMERRCHHSKFDHIRYVCILRFLESIQKNPRSRVESSRTIAKTVYGDNRGGEYRSRCIRLWSDEFVRTGILMPLRQGKHQKCESLIDDPDIKSACLQYLRSRPTEQVDAASFAKWVSCDLHNDESLGLMGPAAITERTARRWLHVLGFRYKEYKKGTYTDGHERPDVVEYRTR